MPQCIINGLRSLLAIAVFAIGAIAIFSVVPGIYASFDVIYLAADNDFYRFVIRLWPPFAILLMFAVLIWITIDIALNAPTSKAMIQESFMIQYVKEHKISALLVVSWCFFVIFAVTSTAMHIILAPTEPGSFAGTVLGLLWAGIIIVTTVLMAIYTHRRMERKQSKLDTKVASLINHRIFSLVFSLYLSIFVAAIIVVFFFAYLYPGAELGITGMASAAILWTAMVIGISVPAYRIMRISAIARQSQVSQR